MWLQCDAPKAFLEQYKSLSRCARWFLQGSSDFFIFFLDYFFSVVSLLVWFSASLAVSNDKNKFPVLAAEQDDSWIPTIVSVSRPLSGIWLVSWGTRAKSKAAPLKPPLNLVTGLTEVLLAAVSSQSTSRRSYWVKMSSHETWQDVVGPAR